MSYHESFEELLAAQPDEVLADFRVSGPGSRQLWKTVPAAAVKHLWEQYMKLGFVRDEDALEQVANQFKENVAKLYGNTVLAGHSSGGEEYMDEVEKIEKKTSRDFGDWILDDSGQWRLSDYGLNPLIDACFKLDEVSTAEEKLLLLDRMLNVVHQRSNLSAMFVEGGSGSLDLLSGQGVESAEEAMKADTVPAFAGSSGGNDQLEMPEMLDPPSGWIVNPAMPETQDPVDRPSVFWPKGRVPGWLAQAMINEPGLGD